MDEHDELEDVRATRFILDAGRQQIVGAAGFPEPPDADGVATIRWAIDPHQQHQGYSRAALIILLEKAATRTDLRALRVTVQDQDLATMRMLAQHGFEYTGHRPEPGSSPASIFHRPLR